MPTAPPGGPGPAPSPMQHEIAGRIVRLPCHVGLARSGAATFLVHAGAARRLLPTDELDVVELWPGRALASLACIDYVENDLGDYHEISLALFVRERSARGGPPILGPALDLLRSRLPTYIHRLPVDQPFTCEAGRRIWGFPKVVHEIDFAYTANRTTCTWRDAGRTVLSVSFPRGGAMTMPETELRTYSMIGGALHATRFVSAASGLGVRLGALGGFALALGDHPIADELRGLGLPKRPLMSVWMERMHARFEAPEKV